MSSSCLSGGGGRAYGGFDLDLVKSPSPSPRSASSSSSPSSTLSDSTNSTPLTISTKKPRTPRKRPNQTYTEAAALLAKIYPTIFSPKHLSKHYKLSTKHHPFLDSSSDLLPPFPEPNSLFQPKPISSLPKTCWIPPGIVSNSFDEADFDAESILDEEVGEGIDSIMGNLTAGEQHHDYGSLVNPYLGQFGGIVNVTRALRHVGNGDWWCSPTVEMKNIVPKLKQPEKRKKKKKKVEKLVNLGKKDRCGGKGDVEVSSRPALGLKLDYDGVMNEWTARGWPFSDSAESPTDIIAKLSDIDLLSEVAGSGGMREASVLRYKEKRRSRLFSKKIKYQVRKLSADRRSRVKASSSGRFAKRDDDE